MQQSAGFHCGYVALVGRPNVGKSTLLNRLLGQKISITSRRPQTTRHSILGIKTDQDTQIIYVDTPGLHTSAPRAMNRYLNRTAMDTLADVDIIVFMVDGKRWLPDDQWILDKLTNLNRPVILAINKVDRISRKDDILPFLAEVSLKYSFTDIVPVSALRGKNTDELEACIKKLLPESVAFFPEDQITDRSERFLAAEMVREKLFRKLGDEIPYGLTVEIEKFTQEGKLRSIYALVLVEKASQKRIVIGKQGQLLKEVGREARQDMQKLFASKVYLQLWVKVKEGWADDERALRSLGYDGKS